MKTKIYDPHVHLFNNNIIDKDIGELALGLVNLIKIGPHDKKAIRAKLQDINEFLEIIGKKESEEVYDVFHPGNIEHFPEAEYEWVYTPLSFDLTYADDNNYKLNASDKALLEKRRLNALKLINSLIKSISVVAMDSGDVSYKQIVSKAKVLLDRLKDTPELINNENFLKKQVPEMEALVEKYGEDKIKPFYSVDPRNTHVGKKDYIKILKQKILNGKWFGIKLYATTGFSPTDPVLFDEGGVFEFCVKHNIPITAHNSDGGFATFANQVRVYGDVYLNGEIVDYRNGGKGTLLTFKHSLISLNAANAVHERVTALNHPRLWEIVLKRYPTLRLNLAHFGGSGSLVRLSRYEIPKELRVITRTAYLSLVAQVENPDDQLFLAEAYKKSLRDQDFNLRKSKFGLRKSRRYTEEQVRENRKKLWEILYESRQIDNWSKAQLDLIQSNLYPNLYVDVSAFSEGRILSFGIPFDKKKILVAPFKKMLKDFSKEVQDVFKRSYFKSVASSKHKFMTLKSGISYTDKLVILRAFYTTGRLREEYTHELDVLKSIVSKKSDTQELFNYLLDNEKFSILEQLYEFKTELYDRLKTKHKKKILYGSDFYFTQLFGPEHEQYVQDFKAVFGDEMNDIATLHPETFLGLEKPQDLLA